MSLPEPQSLPGNADATSQPSVADSKQHLMYKCLLNQHEKKLRKPLPIYQTQNEGSDHQPKFRCTVWIDGVSYTSSNTYPQRKTAEMDASKNAYIKLTQKSKSEALQLIQEDSFFCKSIMAEYAAKMNIEIPKYETSQQATVVPVFRSCLNFNGASYIGECGKNKKEAEQLAARGLILKYLDSELANVMTEIINSKFKHYAEMSKAHEQELNNVVVTQPHIPEASVQAVTPVVPVATQPHIPEASVQTVVTQPVTQPAIAPLVTREHSEISFMGIMPPFRGPVVSAPATSVDVNAVQSAQHLGQFASNPSTDLSLDYIPLMSGQTSEENAQKKRRLDSQMPIPVISGSQVPRFLSQ